MTTATMIQRKASAMRAEYAVGSARFARVSDDRLAAECGFAVGLAITTCRKKVADRLGRSVDVFDKYIAGDKSNPAFRFAQLLLAVDNPAALEVAMNVVTTRRNLESRSNEWLVARWHELMQLESGVQAREDEASQTYYRTRDLSALSAAHKAEATLQQEFAAICDLLSERGIDPMESA